jgi:serine/threonine-protein kinase
MGTVYRAEHVQISKVMAIKLLHRELQQNPENVARFHREAESASRLNHPNTVHVFDFGRTKSGSLYLVMEYVDGPGRGVRRGCARGGHRSSRPQAGEHRHLRRS